ncbi:MAG: hypothetical protein C1942_04625, partial [Prosthecochloris sp.]|uniref:putative Ig domain-containing protein n=1 Tax=Prosthecochloris sp. TaxID=290513 RepID=UPI0013C9730D
MNQRNLIIADSAIQDSDVLLAHIAENADILRISCAGEIHSAFQRAIESGYNAIHILAHGKPGVVILGGQACTEEHFTDIARSLTEKHSNKPSLHFWSCHTGAGTKGQNFVQKLSDLFGSAVSAFSGLVGAQRLGGSWVPDVFSKEKMLVENPFARAAEYAYTLAVPEPDSPLKLTAEQTESGYDVQIWVKSDVALASADIIVNYNSSISDFTGQIPEVTGWMLLINQDPGDADTIIIGGFDMTASPSIIDGSAESDVLLATLSFVVDASAPEFTVTVNPSGTILNDGSAVIPLGTPPSLVIDTNDAPTVTEEIADDSTDEDAAYSYDASANFSDVDTGDTLTYSAALENGDPLPTWLSIDENTGVLSGTPANDDVGQINVKVTATDGDSATASSTYTLTVNNTNDAPTVTTEIADDSTDEDAAYSYDASANFSDVDTGDTLTYSAALENGDPLPTWLSIDENTGVLSGTPANDDVGQISVTVTATDGD